MCGYTTGAEKKSRRAGGEGPPLPWRLVLLLLTLRPLKEQSFMYLIPRKTRAYHPDSIDRALLFPRCLVVWCCGISTGVSVVAASFTQCYCGACKVQGATGPAPAVAIIVFAAAALVLTLERPRRSQQLPSLRVPQAPAEPKATRSRKEQEPVPPFSRTARATPPRTPPTVSEPQDLFVGGLNPSTTEAELEDYFKQYGAGTPPLPASELMAGFPLIFPSLPSLFFLGALGVRAFLRSVQVELRRAVPRAVVPSSAPPSDDPEEKECKVFIGGIPPTMTTEDIHAFFSKRFGMVRRVDFFYDKMTGRMRGFGFLVFSFPHSAKMAVGHHQLGDVVIEVKKAVDKEEMKNQKEAEAASGGGRPPPRRPPPGAQGGMMMRSMRPAMEFVPFEMAMHPVAAAGGPGRGPLQDPYSVFPHAAVAAAPAAVAAAPAAAAAVAPSAYGGAYYPVAEPQQQLAYAGASGGMYVPQGYGYVVAGGAQDVYAHQPGATEQPQIADPYDVQGAMRARVAKAQPRSQPY
ncbi:RNA binding protein [Cyclospora cayetanensis]|uniref:RNA binding protein n=1 Tax=Cyclospora cayetanensis TaxID=88456 RepID=A0A1D3D1I7_9EIME|nr:RNA binding protein [Cyclospora cayetanensis]